MYSDADKIKDLIEQATHIVVIQADNPDADSLGSALALEEILEGLDKQVTLYCAITMPTYLRYLSGWDRVQAEFPRLFDCSIIVDASTINLLEKLLRDSTNKGILKSKPCIVLDHHSSVENEVSFASALINDGARASTGELIYQISEQLKWPMPLHAQELIMSSILGDTQGLSNQLATAVTYRVMASMIEAGVDRPYLEELRRSYNKMTPEVFKYKATLINNTHLYSDGQIAYVKVSQTEITKYSPLYNPAPLIQGDMLQITDVRVAIVFKSYDDGKVTAAIRCNPDAPIAADLAEHFGGGGHLYASGFKDLSRKSYEEIQNECINLAYELLVNLNEESIHEPA